jgi:hypothetical protein
MAKVKLDFGAEVDFLDKGQLDDSLAHYFNEQQSAALAGIKYFRLPRIVGTVASSAVTIGQTGSIQCGPGQGYCWSIRRLIVNGLQSGSSPDIINFYRNDVGNEPLWQLNGNSFGQTFGRLELLLLPGEYLVAQNVGTINATGQIRVTGDAIEVPAELLGKLA